MVWLRALMAVLLAAVLVVAVVPLVVLFNLSGGGTGYGVCPHGLASCEVSYTRGLELLLVLIVLLFLLLAAIRVAARGMRHIRREQELDEAVRRLNGQA
ncbi:MAG: hypothetical protein WAM81_03900 [Acidimicrobiia bacterium]